ncbi:MAG: rhomboid family intramembrane serine protease [Candidatus Omnitrophota bacterium]
MNIFGQRSSYSGFNIVPGFYGTVKVLVVVNVVIFVLLSLFNSTNWIALFGLIPSAVFFKFRIWQLVTYLFIHAGLWHLVLNMLMLWMFGSVIENIWGSKRFLQYYFFTGIGAGLCSVLFSFGSPYPIVGASGAIFGLLVAYALMFPDNIILLFFIFPMKMKHAAIVLAVINLLGALSSSGSGIAYIAHLGGGVLGYLYLKSEALKFKMAAFSPFGIKKQREIADLDHQVDNILDKISREGMDSLSAKEKKILEIKSKKDSV